MQRTLSALYDHRTDAMSAVDDLIAAGISRDHISVISGSEPGESGDKGTTYGTEREEPGFWESLASIFSTEEERRVHDEGISRGGATIVATVDDSQLDRAIDILESHNAADLEERERSWNAGAGDGPYRPGAPSIGMGAETGSVPTAGAAPGMAAPQSMGRTFEEQQRAASGEEAIPIAQEELHVGKRDVRSGRVRVHTRVVEEPVSEDVRLREESVAIERTPVDRSKGGIAREPFQERTIEAEERHEEPVVSKEARVTEELRLRKETGERVERVQDTVRHTEVDVEDDRSETEKGRS